jgi:probable phosphoglycerate mutase
VRHGDTEWTHTGQHTGRTDLPLLPEGEAQARRVGESLRHVRFAAAFTSDLRRARRTAELAGFPDARVTPLLREFDYGEYEGLTSAEIWERRPGWELYADGCPGGEAPAQVRERALACLGLLQSAGSPVVAFSHGHFSRALGAVWPDLDIEVAAHLALDTAAISVLHDGGRGRMIQRWNWEPAP